MSSKFCSQRLPSRSFSPSSLAPRHGPRRSRGGRNTPSWPSRRPGPRRPPAVWRCGRGGREAEAELYEVGGGGRLVQSVSQLVFSADGGCVVTEFSSGGYWVEVGWFPRGGVRWCWAKGPGGQWKVWAEADTGEKILLNQTFQKTAPQLVLGSGNNWRSLDISLLPLQPGPGSVSQAELRAQVDQLTSEVQSERAQKAELQQRLTQEQAEARFWNLDPLKRKTRNHLT